MLEPTRQAPIATEKPFASLAERSLLIVSGKGGVGRTTVAALLASALADGRRRILVATTGHDDRLAWMLGAESLSDQARELAPGLFAQRLTPSVCVREYGGLVLRNEWLAKGVFENRLVKGLLGAVPGLDDFAILGKVWHEAFRGDDYDLVIFDGPATGHLRLNLGVPRAIIETVSAGPLRRDAEAIRASLADRKRTASVLVSLPERWPLTELGELARDLRKDQGIAVGALVVNKVWPADLPPLDGVTGSEALQAFLSVVEEIGERGRRQAETVSQWLQGEELEGETLLSVPWWPQGIETRASLRALLDETQLVPTKPGASGQREGR